MPAAMQARATSTSRSRSGAVGGSSPCRDDGVGFDETAVIDGQGVANMRSRAEAIDGALTLRSRPGRGTAIEVVLRPA